MRGLYPIVDLTTLARHGRPVLAFTEEVLAVRPALLQLRAKDAPAREVLDWLRQLVPRCHAVGTKLIANDRPDLALLAGCDGVHLGQEDLPIGEVRLLAGNRLEIGVSTHDLGQLERALDTRPDYVAFGPIFATASKEAPDPVVGLNVLQQAATLARAAGVPLVAIGGIDLVRAPRVAESGALGAVIGALLPAAEATTVSAGPSPVTERAWALHRALGG